MKPIILSEEERKRIEKQRQETHDKRIFARLSAVVWVADGRSRQDVAKLLHISFRQLRSWLCTYRNKGLAALCLFHYQGDPGKLTSGQVQVLKDEVAKACFAIPGRLSIGSM